MKKKSDEKITNDETKVIKARIEGKICEVLSTIPYSSWLKSELEKNQVNTQPFLVKEVTLLNFFK